MSWLKKVLKSSADLAIDPFDKDRLRDQQVELRSGIGTGAGPGERGVTSAEKNKAPGESDDPAKIGSASWKIGELMRKEWDDYVTRFQPYDKKLIGIATGQADNDAMVANARAGVNNSFAVSNGTTLRNLSRLGISQSSDEVLSNNRINDTNKTLADISTSNNARMAAEDRDMKIMSGNAAVGLRDSRLRGA